MAEDDQDVKPEILQSVIDTFANRLVGLRTQCSTSNELTQSEIRALEGKLIKLFSRQYVNIIKLRQKYDTTPSNLRNTPSLEQWLQVVGLCTKCIQRTCTKLKTMENLLENSQYLLEDIFLECAQFDEECRRLTTALKNLKRCIEILLQNENEANQAVLEIIPLHWDSWNWQSNNLTSSYSSQDCPAIRFNGNNSIYADHTTVNNTYSKSSSSTPPVLSPPLTPIHKVKQEDHVTKSPGSVSDNYRYTPVNSRVYRSDGNIETSQIISKSRSHESQLYNLISRSGMKVANNFIFNSENGEVRSTGRIRLPTVPGPEHTLPSSFFSSPTKSPPFTKTTLSNSETDSLLTVKLDSSPVRNHELISSTANISVDQAINRTSLPTVPRSPRTPTAVNRVMAHYISHRFTKRFSISKPCDYCCKPIIMNTGLKCKECRYRCHIDCESRVPPSCGLPSEFVDEFKKRVTPTEINNHPSTTICSNGADSSPLNVRHTAGLVHSSPGNGFLSSLERRVKAVVQSTFLSGSESAASSHSSAPSSPALFVSNIQIPKTAGAIPNNKQKFDFSPDVINQETNLISTIDTQNTDSSSEVNEAAFDKNVNREDSQDSQNWDGESMDKVWPRQYSVLSFSVSMKEWEIPWSELKRGEQLGTGHFGTVYSGYWHGDVAIKVLNMEYLGDEKMLENFKSEVSTFRKTRHDNLVLFMGACMQPPRLAIVTSMVHGITLYKYIHLRRDKFSMGKTTIIAQQISQGMGYLHAKNIVHKDLRTKNIFLEKERVIITDFGLFSVTKLCFKNRNQDGLIIPPGWLCYLSPEIMRNLRVHVKPDDEHLPFSKASDVYAFGTVWYELLCGEWPFTTQEPEAVIWQVGKGVKPSLANLEASRDVKDILMQCWAYADNRRPDFTLLLKTLEKLPKKKLARSPSHPVHLSRSAESMF
ncbi:hypothetical protein PGB90_005993 [Kerria lacca]